MIFLSLLLFIFFRNDIRNRKYYMIKYWVQQNTNRFAEVSRRDSYNSYLYFEILCWIIGTEYRVSLSFFNAIKNAIKEAAGDGRRGHRQ